MSSKRKDSDSESSPEPEKDVSNAFANDGSFLEMFKRRMEEQKRKESGEKSRTYVATKNEPPLPPKAIVTPITTSSTTKLASSAPLSSGTGVPKASVNKPYQGIIGKRKALMKSIELREKRKRKREEIEEQQLAEEEEGKGSAWKAYLAEVKAYEKRSCKDPDDYKTPLVK